MVEYALLVAHNTSNLLTLAGTDVMAWASGLELGPNRLSRGGPGHPQNGDLGVQRPVMRGRN